MGSSSGLIIAFVVVVWAAYFIPLALRRYDEASKNASVETSGSLSRVINRPARQQQATAGEPVEVVEASAPEAPRLVSRPPRSVDRPAARLAARRRRRTLLTLLLITAVVTGVAVAGVIAVPWVAAPVALVVAWLVACRVQVLRERSAVRTRTSSSSNSGAAGSPAGRRIHLPHLPRLRVPRVHLPVAAFARVAGAVPRVKAPRQAGPTADVEEDTVVVSGQFEDIDPGRKHQMEDVVLEADALDDKIVIAVPSVSTAGEALWDPLPVTLPTYVTKPRAGRTVRTIDFSQPHTWTSGHIEGEDVELPKRSDDTGEQRRAVGH